MKTVFASAAGAVLLGMLAVPANADSKFSGVAPAQHRSHGHYSSSHGHYQNHSSYRYQRQYRNRRPLQRYRGRHNSRLSYRDHRGYYERHYRGSRYGYDRRHYRDDRRRYRRGHRVRLGECVYLTPHGLTVYFSC